MSERRAALPPKTVRVVSPAGPVNEADVDAGVQLLRGRGFSVEVAPHVKARCGYLAGADEERLDDLQATLDDPLIDAVWFARGGYGTTRLLPRLSAEGLRSHPKVLLGFSDATALFAWAQDLPGVRCLYAPSLQELAREGVCRLDSLWAALSGKGIPIAGDGPEESAGPFAITGGCLTLCSVSAGTPWEPEVSGRWLFLEDVGEPLYRLDRMLTHLAQAGWLERCAGLLLGGFTGLAAGETYDDVAARASDLLSGGKPLVAGLPVGHLKGKHTLPFGVPATWNGSHLFFEGIG